MHHEHDLVRRLHPLIVDKFLDLSVVDVLNGDRESFLYDVFGEKVRCERHQIGIVIGSGLEIDREIAVYGEYALPRMLISLVPQRFGPRCTKIPDIFLIVSSSIIPVPAKLVFYLHPVLAAVVSILVDAEAYVLAEYPEPVDEVVEIRIAVKSRASVDGVMRRLKVVVVSRLSAEEHPQYGRHLVVIVCIGREVSENSKQLI